MTRSLNNSTGSRRPKIYLALLLLLCLLMVIYLLFKKATTPSETIKKPLPVNQAQTNPSAISPEQQEDIIRDSEGYEILSEDLLQGYASTKQSPQEDLQQLMGLLDSYNILIKGTGFPAFGENRELTAALQGENPYKTRFINKAHPAVNSLGEIIDRWGSPIFFHSVDSKQIGIRMAGPDKAMWSADDIYHEPEGSPLSSSTQITQ